MIAIIEKIRSLIERIKYWIDTLFRRKERALQNQWHEHHDLPPRENRAALPKRKGDLYQQWVEEGSLAPEDVEKPVAKPVGPEASAASSTAPVFSGRLTLYLIISGVVNLVLLITVAVLATIVALKGN
jgi:hypothetical protein